MAAISDQTKVFTKVAPKEGLEENVSKKNAMKRVILVDWESTLLLLNESC